MKRRNPKNNMKSSSYTSRGGIGEITNQTHEPFFKKKKKKHDPYYNTIKDH